MFPLLNVLLNSVPMPEAQSQTAHHNPLLFLSDSKRCPKKRSNLNDGEQGTVSGISVPSAVVCSGDCSGVNALFDRSDLLLLSVKDSSLFCVRTMAVWRSTRSLNSCGKGSNYKRPEPEIKSDKHGSIKGNWMFITYRILWFQNILMECVHCWVSTTTAGVRITWSVRCDILRIVCWALPVYDY